MKTTTNLGLPKPEADEFYDVAEFGKAMDMLDSKLNEVLTKIDTANKHITNKENPHGVTKKQIGLENVENKSSETIRGELTDTNIEAALDYKPVSPTDLDNYKSSLKGSLEGIGKIQMTSGKYRKMFYLKVLVKTNSSGRANTNAQIKDDIEALGGKWDFGTIVFGFSEDTGVMISAHPDIVTSSDTYGEVNIRAYDADGSAHYDSGDYTNTPVVLLIFTNEA